MGWNNQMSGRERTVSWWSRGIVLAVGLIFLQLAGRAQLVDATKTMLEQIAALETYKNLCANGYKIAETGIQAIKSVKGAEYDMHSVYFASLKKVSPQVSGYLSQSGALTMAQNMVADLQRFSATITSSAVLLVEEKQYAAGLLTAFQSLAQEDLDMITSILSDGQTSMSDGERITRLTPIVQTIKEQHRIAEHFIDQTGLLMARRLADQTDNRTIQSFY
jgi:hypothetical protein